MNKTLSKIEIFRIILDVVVIIVMVVGVLVALNANKNAVKAVQAQYIPWLQINDISTSFEQETLFVKYGIHNFSNAPATEVTVKLQIGNVSSEANKPPDTYLPNTDGKLQFRIQGNSDVRRMHSEIMKGEVPIKFIISYSDIFGNNFQSITQTRYDGNYFRNDSFEIEGVSNVLQ